MVEKFNERVGGEERRGEERRREERVGEERGGLAARRDERRENGFESRDKARRRE